MAEQPPPQPLYRDPQGVIRFRANAVVRHLLDRGGLTLNDLPWGDFPQEDVDQFHQLIGYSLAGYGDLAGSDIVSGAAADRAEEAALAAGLLTNK
jgi:hypothetical protein